jgi:mono/diheme cytochrome c family protein
VAALLPERADHDCPDRHEVLLSLIWQMRVSRSCVAAAFLAAVSLPPLLDAAAGAASAQAAGPSPSIQRGMMMARTHCGRCHAIDKTGQSPLPIAPPFRDLHKNYPVEQLEEPLAEGLVTGHPSMPEFRFDPNQIGDFIAFLKSLE